MVLHCMRFEPGNRSLTTRFTHRADTTTKTGSSSIMPSSNSENRLCDSDAFLLTDNLVPIVPSKVVCLLPKKTMHLGHLTACTFTGDNVPSGLVYQR